MWVTPLKVSSSPSLEDKNVDTDSCVHTFLSHKKRGECIALCFLFCTVGLDLWGREVRRACVCKQMQMKSTPHSSFPEKKEAIHFLFKGNEGKCPE